jgi:hypothetical protein
MTQTPDPDCTACGGTGFVPPFMDPCDCESDFLTQIDAAAEAAAEVKFTGTAHPAVGDTRITSTGVAVWTGSEWTSVETEALTAAEYAAKYPKLPSPLSDEASDESWPWDEIQVDPVAEEVALAIAAAVVDEVDAEPLDDDPDVDYTKVTTTDIVNDTLDAAADAIADEIIDHYGEDAITAAVHATADDDGQADLGAVLDEMAKEPPTDWVDTTAVYTEPKPPRKPATAPQKALLARLTAERDSAHPVVAHALKQASWVALSASQASTLIDSLLAVPADPAKQTDRPNRYDGVCRDCGGSVPAETGTIRKVDGRWTTYHKAGECLNAEGKAALEAERVDEPGLYKMLWEGDIVIYRVRKARHSSRLYAEKVNVHVVTIAGETAKHVEFVYNAKAMAWLRKSDRLTWLEARSFGAAYGACVACGRTLSDARSLVQGYGATCAGHYHWPTVTKKQAESIIEGVLTWDDVVAGLGVLTS